jgi:ABC-type Fe3+ transport system substrate-binding protein
MVVVQLSDFLRLCSLGEMDCRFQDIPLCGLGPFWHGVSIREMVPCPFKTIPEERPMPETLLDLTIHDLVSRHPETEPLFTANGLHLFADQQVRETFGRALTLRTVLRAAGINGGSFRTLLSHAIDAQSLNSTGSPSRPLSLFALLPCPLKVPLEEAVNDFLEELDPRERAGLTCRIEGNANNQIEYADYADHFQEIGEMPDIIISPGFNSFYHPGFVQRFIHAGCFRGVNLSPGDRHLSPLGVVDPDSHYTMLAMNLLLPVVDLTRLGSRPVPRRWEDLLDPVYGKSIAIRGNRVGTFCETLLLSMFRDFGREGLVRLGRTVAWGWHPSQMVKAAGSGQEGTPAISVMPLFFANTIKNRDRISVVWPEDGALVSPVTMLVKAEAQERLRPLIDFLTGPRVAAICAGASFPALHPAVDNRLPEGACFKWIGWEYIKNNDLKSLIADTNADFLASFRGEEP